MVNMGPRVRINKAVWSKYVTTISKEMANNAGTAVRSRTRRKITLAGARNTSTMWKSVDYRVTQGRGSWVATVSYQDKYYPDGGNYSGAHEFGVGPIVVNRMVYVAGSRPGDIQVKRAGMKLQTGKSTSGRAGRAGIKGVVIRNTTKGIPEQGYLQNSFRQVSARDFH